MVRPSEVGRGNVPCHHPVVEPTVTEMDRIPNFRGIGGLPTTDGRTTVGGLLWRSGHLGRASNADLVRLHALGIRPTLLDLTGLPPLEELDGQSLREALSSGGSIDPRQLFAEAVSPRRWVNIWQFENWNPPLVAVRSAGSKFIVHRPSQGDRQPTLRFDLTRDPLEREPIPVVGAQLAEVEALVDRYLGRAAPAAAPTVSPDLEDRRRALGYGE